MRKENVYKLLAIVLGISLLIVLAISLGSKKTLGGSVHNTQEVFANGIVVGSKGKLVIDSNGRIIRGGKVLTLSPATSTTLTVDQVCNYNTINVTPTAAVPTLTLPTFALLSAGCLSVDSQNIDLQINSIATSTTLAAGSSGTLGYTSSATIANAKYGILRIARDSATTYKAYLINITN